MKDLIEAKLNEAGIFHVGFTQPVIPEADQQVFLEWIQAGNAAQMAYLARPDTLEKRLNPLALMPEARSVIVVAVPYPGELSPALDLKALPPGGRVAAYARSRDYHLVLPEILDQVMFTVRVKAGQDFHWKVFTDSAPILERSLAVQAGLGWIGRNSNLLIPGVGSAFLLAEIFTNLDLPPDTPYTEDRCGSCTRCLTSCPTGCITPYRTLAAPRCISFLTIENRASVPPPLRSKLGGWAFGCDICQQVCPWNRFQPPPDLLQPELSAWLPAAEFIDLSPAHFRERYRESPLLRPKLAGIQRNLALSLTHRPLPENAVLLGSWVQDADPLVRLHAAWALTQSSDPACQSLRQERLELEQDPQVRAELLGGTPLK